MIGHNPFQQNNLVKLLFSTPNQKHRLEQGFKLWTSFAQHLIQGWEKAFLSLPTQRPGHVVTDTVGESPLPKSEPISIPSEGPTSLGTKALGKIAIAPWLSQLRHQVQSDEPGFMVSLVEKQNTNIQTPESGLLPNLLGVQQPIKNQTTAQAAAGKEVKVLVQQLGSLTSKVISNLQRVGMVSKQPRFQLVQILGSKGALPQGKSLAKNDTRASQFLHSKVTRPWGEDFLAPLQQESKNSLPAERSKNQISYSSRLDQLNQNTPKKKDKKENPTAFWSDSFEKLPWDTKQFYQPGEMIKSFSHTFQKKDQSNDDFTSTRETSVPVLNQALLKKTSQLIDQKILEATLNAID